MNGFRVVFQSGAEFQALAAAEGSYVEGYSWAAVGGPEEASIVLKVGEAVFPHLPQMLGDPLTIYDPLHRAVWWGYVEAVDLGAAVYSLEDTFNRVRARYTDGSLTAWAEDTSSVKAHGEKEYLLWLPNATQEAAEAARDAFLNKHAHPRALPLLRSDLEADEARLRCKGWFSTLDWQFYGYDLRAVSSAWMPVNIAKAIGSNTNNLRYAQAFTVPTGETWTLRGVRFEMDRIGMPEDRILVRLCADNAGAPGDSLAIGGVDGGSFPLGPAFSMITVSLDRPVTLSAGTYWVMWNRNGAVSAIDHNRLHLSNLSGTYLMYNSTGAWTTTTGTIRVEVIGGQHLSTGMLIERTANDTGQFFEGVSMVGLHPPAVVVPSTPLADEYAPGTQTGAAVLAELMSYGTLDDRRLLATVTHEGVLRFYPAPEVEDAVLQVAQGGVLTRRGIPVDPFDLGRLVGQWAVPATPAVTRVDGAFIERAEVDARTGALRISPAEGDFDVMALARRLSQYLG